MLPFLTEFKQHNIIPRMEVKKNIPLAKQAALEHHKKWFLETKTNGSITEGNLHLNGSSSSIRAQGW